MSVSSLFTMLPPFPEKPLYSDVNSFLEKIEGEFALKVKTYSYKKSAFDHDVFIINDKIVFRFPRIKRAGKHLKHEIAFLNFLKERVAIDIPEYSYVSKTCDFAGYAIIRGETLTSSVFQRLSKKDKENALNQLIRFVNDLHRIGLADFTKYRPRRREEFIGLEQRIERELEVRLFPKLSKKEIDVIKKFYQESKKHLQQVPKRCATHGDLYARNVIWDKDASTIGVIDFSDYLIGDPAKDFEVFYGYGRNIAEIAYEKYEGAKDKNFLNRAGIYHRVHAIYTLLSSVCGARVSFETALLSFKQRFHSPSKSSL